MLVEEARWLGAALGTLPPSAFPLLNLGSSSAEFRRHAQPWIEDEIFGPLSRVNRRVLHADIVRADGVDISADFTDPDDRQRLLELHCQSVLCSNLLEHLAIPPAEAAKHVCALVPVGGYLIVSAPMRYGYHPDPIDNDFRPTPAELAQIFPGFAVLSMEEVRSRRQAFYFADAGKEWMRFAARLVVPFYRPRRWMDLARDSFINTAASCVVLRRDV